MTAISFAACLAAARRRAARGRVRVFASPGAGLGAKVEDGCEVARDEVLACAAAAAWAEAPRGGVVLVAIEGQPEPAALSLIARLAAENVLLLAGCADGIGTLIALGSAPLAEAATVAVGAPAARARQRREWSPVHLASLPSSGAPPWPEPAAAEDAARAVEDALAWLAAREPRLVIAHQHQPWRDLPQDGATAAALAQLAGEGRRVVWRLGCGGLGACTQAAAAAAARGLALKLLIDAEDLPAQDSRLSARAWVVSASDAREADAMLAWGLAHEDAVVMGLGAPADVPRWEAQVPWTPGQGRWLRAGAAGTIACSAQGAPIAWAACAEAGADIGVLQCSSLSPLPAAALRLAPRPLWALEALAPRGFARAVAGLAEDAAAARDGRALARALASARA